MNLYSDLKEKLYVILEEMKGQGALPADASLDAVTVEPPRDASHGDMATNAAMVLAGQTKSNPRAVAEPIAQALRLLDNVTDVQIAGPGFINVRFAPAFWQGAVYDILSAGNSYGNSAIGAGRDINVEYVSANPTGPLHVGHTRGAVYGDALALLLLKAGYKVTKEYYINDAGAQVDVLARSAYLRYREACGEAIDIPAGLYPGEYLIAVGESLKQVHGTDLLGKGESEWLEDVKAFAIESMLAMIKDDLLALGIQHDVFISEKSLYEGGKIPEAIGLLTAKGLIYRGVLEPPKGKKPADWEEREQLLFKSTDYGDDVDRALQKPDGSYTYFAADLAYAQHKIARGFDTLVYMLGADHGGYRKRMEAAISALSDRKVATDIKLCQMVNLLKDGEPVKMSKRAGNFETARDVLEAVGKDILRFIMLTRKSDMVMDFDLDKVKEQSKENPVFYVQYAHARAKSLLRLAGGEMPEALAQSAQPDASLLALLASPAELGLIQLLAQYPRMVEAAAMAYEPHRIAFYVQEVAAAFHGLWNMGNGAEELRFVVRDDPQLTAARLSLARAVTVVVASALTVLGVTPAEEL